MDGFILGVLGVLFIIWMAFVLFVCFCIAYWVWVLGAAVIRRAYDKSKKKT